MEAGSSSRGGGYKRPRHCCIKGGGAGGMSPAVLREGGDRGCSLTQSPRGAGAPLPFREGRTRRRRRKRRADEAALRPCPQGGPSKTGPGIGVTPAPSCGRDVAAPRASAPHRRQEGPQKGDGGQAGLGCKCSPLPGGLRWEEGPGASVRTAGGAPALGGAAPWKAPGCLWGRAGRHPVCEGDTAPLAPLALVEARPPAAPGERARSALLQVSFPVAAWPRVERSPRHKSAQQDSVRLILLQFKSCLDFFFNKT